jgi:hypothetical protein
MSNFKNGFKNPNLNRGLVAQLVRALDLNTEVPGYIKNVPENDKIIFRIIAFN